MQTREIPLKAGAFGWALDRHPYGLPAGLEHGTLVKVIRNEVGEVDMTVSDRTGRQWTFLRGIVVPRLQYWCVRSERWVSESSTRGQELLREEIQWQREKLTHEVKTLRTLYWQAERSASAEDLSSFGKLMESDPLAGMADWIGSIGPQGAARP